MAAVGVHELELLLAHFLERAPRGPRTRDFQQSCSDNPDCESEGETSKEISLSPEMGRVLKSPLLNR